MSIFLYSIFCSVKIVLNKFVSVHKIVLRKKIYNLKSSKAPEIINVNSKYYIAEISEIEKRNRPFSDPEVQESLNTQLNFIFF